VRRLFGTDGVRGLVGADLSPELALAIASAAARVLGAGSDGRRRTAVVGRDPRLSGEMLQAAVTAGLTAEGIDVVLLGVLPTPAVAFLTADLDADLGVVLSASHNPMPDNGIKLFTRGGDKLPDDVETAIEAAMTTAPTSGRPTGAAIGRVREHSDALDRYADHLLTTPHHPLTGLRVVVDCANGAASAVAPQVYRRAGASVVEIGTAPDGENINQGCGSTDLRALIAALAAAEADIGIAHDGDADRCLAVTPDGHLVDGDSILAICALALREAGELRDDAVVATVMSNLGFHHAMREHGISVVSTPVGDRYLLEALRERGLSLGGEQSGHLVFADHATTGDGLLTALAVLSRMAATGRSIAELAAIVRRLPQVLLNVPVSDRSTAARAPAVLDAVAAAEAELGDSGRVVLRPSGTEALVRVMVEAPTDDDAHRIAERLARVVAAS